MRKQKISILLLASLLLLGGCGANSNTVSNSNQKPKIELAQFPKIDGSASMIPLSAALMQSLAGASVQQSEDYTMHDGAIAGYYNLLNDEADLVFAPKMTDTINEYSQKSNVQAAFKPIVCDALVFLVHKDNPVNNITLEQAKKIFKGEITSWTELGGSGAIELYASQEGTTSHALMYQTLLGKDDQMSSAKVEYVPSEYGEMSEELSVYSNSAGAIGYSSFYYVDRLLDMKDYKLLTVNGIAPTLKTIQDKSYPLRADICAVYDGKLKAGSDVIKIVNYLTSADGISYLKSLGYAPAQNK